MRVTISTNYVCKTIMEHIRRFINKKIQGKDSPFPESEDDEDELGVDDPLEREDDLLAGRMNTRMFARSRSSR